MLGMFCLVTITWMMTFMSVTKQSISDTCIHLETQVRYARREFHPTSVMQLKICPGNIFPTEAKASKLRTRKGPASGQAQMNNIQAIWHGIETVSASCTKIYLIRYPSVTSPCNALQSDFNEEDPDLHYHSCITFNKQSHHHRPHPPPRKKKKNRTEKSQSPE